jgi:hypothetical protein
VIVAIRRRTAVHVCLPVPISWVERLHAALDSKVLAGVAPSCFRGWPSGVRLKRLVPEAVFDGVQLRQVVGPKHDMAWPTAATGKALQSSGGQDCPT